MTKAMSDPGRPPKCETKSYDAMVLSCIDPRIIDQVRYYMEVTKGLRCKYSQFVIAGAAVGVVAPRFRNWHETFWENLASSIELHGIKRVFAIDHRDCGAAKLAYGEKNIKDPVKEKAVHELVMNVFRRELNRLHPKLQVVTILMDLNGDVEILK